MKELRIIKIYFSNSLQQNLSNMIVFWMFFMSKLIRYGLFLFFIFLMTSQMKFLGGYSPLQMLVFYLCFNIVDTIGQLLFREVYRFRSLVVTGGLDMVLVKPLNPLIRVLVGGPDFIDLGVLLIILVVFGVTLLLLQPSMIMLLGFVVLLVNSLLISGAFHILVLSLGVLTTSVDHLIMVYRDMTGLVRVPVDFYTQPLRFLITFIIPLGIMYTFPAQALMGFLSIKTIILSLVGGSLSLFLSIKFWNYSLKHYQSASS
jgi:ABC-2 type transport system permease protein